MRKLTLILIATATATSATAHPANVAFDSRGECESAMAKVNILDREKDVASGRFETHGEANRYYHETWSCKQRSDGKWYMTREPV